MVDILIGNVTLENLLIFIFIFLITAVAGNTCYALIRKLLDDRLSLRNSKLIAKVFEYIIFLAGLSYGYPANHPELYGRIIDSCEQAGRA